MPHEVESMMYLGNVPWHEIGVELKDPPTAAKAIKAAGLDWNVNLKPIYTSRKNASFDEVNLHKAVIRESDDSVLGIVGNRWTPLQNREAFKFFDPFVKEKFASYHTAGSLRGGKRIWILVKLKSNPIKIARGDEIEKYLLLSNAHDGKVAINVRFTPIRVVCNNTLTMAEKDNESPFLRILHRGNISETLEEVQQVVNIANETFETTVQLYKQLVKKQVHNLERYIIKTLKPNIEDNVIEEIKRPRAVNKIIEYFETGRGHDIKSIKGSYWSAYNAVTAWVDYGRGKDNIRLDKAWFGKGQKIKENALRTAAEMANLIH